MGRRLRKKRARRHKIVVNGPQQKSIIIAVALFPTVSLTLSTVIVAFFCRRLLTEASMAEAQLPSLVPLFLSVLGFVLVSGAVVLHQALRFSHRIAGPTYRIVESLRRVHGGDIGFRVCLRDGDYLTEIAEQLNALLDWLNENPPRGVTTGSDVVRMEEHEEHTEEHEDEKTAEADPDATVHDAKDPDAKDPDATQAPLESAKG